MPTLYCCSILMMSENVRFKYTKQGSSDLKISIWSQLSQVCLDPVIVYINFKSVMHEQLPLGSDLLTSFHLST